MSTVKEYVDGLPEDRQVVIKKPQSLIKKNIPKGFEEQMSYGMIGYVVPHTIYPDGYHCDPKLPLPFLSIASQKNFIAIYHMGMYAKPELLDWFTSEYPKYCKSKLDMGKSCVRFKKMEDIPYALLEELMKKLTVADWISIYEKNYKK
jgi:hypothetical protein